jgi:hypothetical protein
MPRDFFFGQIISKGKRILVAKLLSSQRQFCMFTFLLKPGFGSSVMDSIISGRMGK